MRGFDAVNVLAKAITQAKEPTAAKIMEALRTVESPGLYGLNKFDKNGQSYPNIMLTQVKDGKMTVVGVTPSAKLWSAAAPK
jgi:ABC-type branched-subunit amino acid transport system substrate-binding protein